MLGVKYRKTLEKGDTLIAGSTINIYELQDDGSLKVIDTAIKGDTIGYYSGRIVKFDDSIQYVEFVTPDALLGDGSPDFTRIRLYFNWEDDMDYVANPKYTYPDRETGKQETMVVAQVAQTSQWIDKNAKKILLFVGLLSIATILINVATYIIKKQKSKQLIKPVQK